MPNYKKACEYASPKTRTVASPWSRWSGDEEVVPRSRRGPVGLLLGELTVGAITLYQRRLSPLKGFSCAHRVLHGGESCSQHVKDLVAELGPLAAASPARGRLRACRESNEALRAGATPAMSSSETGGRRRRRRPWFRRWGRRSRDEAEDFFEADDPGTGDGEASWCEPDSLECDSCDCGLDCSP